MVIGMHEGVFTAYKLSDFINPAKKGYASARRIINGVNKKDVIKKYAEEFERCLLVQ